VTHSRRLRAGPQAWLDWQRAGTSFSSPGSHAGLIMNLVDQGRGHGVVITTRSIRASRSLGCPEPDGYRSSSQSRIRKWTGSREARCKPRAGAEPGEFARAAGQRDEDLGTPISSRLATTPPVQILTASGPGFRLARSVTVSRVHRAAVHTVGLLSWQVVPTHQLRANTSRSSPNSRAAGVMIVF
jgi:hypothetical protein